MIRVLLTTVVCFYFMERLLKGMQLLQLNHYENKKYLLSVLFEIKKRKIIVINLLLLFIIFVHNDVIDVVTIIIVIMLFVFHMCEKRKIKLRFTPRIYRVLIMLILFASLIMFFLRLNGIYVCALVSYFLLYISNGLMKPIERLISKKYILKAKEILRVELPYVIGITGSGGKTSTKNILFDLLSSQYLVSKTPLSYNTVLGICLSVNTFFTSGSDYFIVEMGACKKGDIKELVDFVKPKIGLLTTITMQHLESFKTMENLINTKFELIEGLDENGIGFINIDNSYIREYTVKNKCKIITFGIHFKADYMARNIKIQNKLTNFDIYYKDDVIVQLETSLLGKLNIYNILSSVAIAHTLGANVNDIKYAVYRLRPTDHRLSSKTYDQLTIIDDSFNANPIGSKNALDVLMKCQGKKYIITPGMIELGPKQYELNYEFGKQMIGCCDAVYLVGRKQTNAIYDAICNSIDEIKIFSSFQDAMDYFNKQYHQEEAVLLIENDLPDIYNE